MADAAKAMDVGLSTMTRWVKQLRDECQGKTPKASTITPEQIEIRELRKKLQRIEMENEILKKATHSDVRLPEQFSIIGKLRAHYPVATLCHVFGVHRSSYRYWKNRPEKPDGRRAVLRSQVLELHGISHGSGRSKKHCHNGNPERLPDGTLACWQAHEGLGLVSCQQPTHRYKRGGHEHVAIPNYLERQFAVTGPNQVWCGDVTCIWTGKRRAYLAGSLDLFARKPVGWAMSFSPDSRLTMKALEMAWETRGKPGGVMFHSDSNNAGISFYHHSVCCLTRLV